MIKLSILMVRRSDLTYEQFIQHWGEVHGPLVAAQSESKQYVRRYIQDHRTSDALPGTTASNFDGIAEIWFDDISGAKAFFESDGYRQNVIPDEEAFMDRKRCELLYTHEHRESESTGLAGPALGDNAQPECVSHCRTSQLREAQHI
jgi:uncharacterized protein (TIGR02118 family)